MTFTTTTNETGTEIFSGGYMIYPASVSFSVAGVGSGTFTSSIDLFVNQGFPGAGIGDYSNGGLDFLDLKDSAFSTYFFGTDIGPIFNAMPDFGYTQGPVGTSLGALNYSGATNATFTASSDAPPAATPEPSSFLLLGSGLVGLVGAIRKKLA